MKKALVCVSLFAFTALLFARIGGSPTVLGTITLIEKKGELQIATVKVSDVPAADVPRKVKEGNSVRIMYSIGTAQFRLPIGRVLSIKKNGEVLVAVDEALLEQDVEDPFARETFKVRELFTTGAEVSLSEEST